MIMVKEFGGINTVLVGNTRKALTIVLSFLLFPKPGSYLYVVGSVLVFGGLIGSAYCKESNKVDKKPVNHIKISEHEESEYCSSSGGYTPRLNAEQQRHLYKTKTSQDTRLTHSFSSPILSLN